MDCEVDVYLTRRSCRGSAGGRRGRVAARSTSARCGPGGRLGEGPGQRNSREFGRWKEILSALRLLDQEIAS